MNRSKAGLLPYPNSADFVRIIPNKVGEYLSASLPIVSLLGGEVASLIIEHGVGVAVTRRDVGSFVGAVELMCDDQSKRDEFSAHALRLFQREFDSSVVLRAYELALLEIAQKRRTTL